MKKIGVLSFQGNYFQHGKILDRLGVESAFVKYPDQLNDTTRETIVSSIVESNSINIKKEKRRTPKNAIDEANKIIQNDTIDQEQTKIINDYIKYLQSVNA